MGFLFFKAILVYLIVAGIVSLIAQPIDAFFSKLHIGKRPMPEGPSALLAFFAILILFIGFFSLFIPLIVQEAGIISSINPQQVLQSLNEPLKEIEFWIAKHYGDTANFEAEAREKITAMLTAADLPGIFRSAVSTTGSFLTGVFAVSFITFFFLRDRKMIQSTLLLLVPERHMHAAKNVLTESQRLLKRYFLGICIDSLLVMTLIGTGLWILGVKNALLIGLFAGVMNIIPYVGPPIGLAFGIFIGITTYPELDFYSQMLPLAGKITLIFLLVLTIDFIFFQPMIFSGSVKAHPLEIFLVVLIAGKLAGVGGMVLAIPSYTILRVIAKEFFIQFRIVKRLTKNLDD